MGLICTAPHRCLLCSSRVVVKGLGQVVLQPDDIISGEGEQERMYVCIRKNCERHDGLGEASTVDKYSTCCEILHPDGRQILPKQPPYNLGNRFVRWQMGVC